MPSLPPCGIIVAFLNGSQSQMSQTAVSGGKSQRLWQFGNTIDVPATAKRPTTLRICTIDHLIIEKSYSGIGFACPFLRGAAA